MNATTTNPAGCIGAGCDCDCHKGPSYPVFRADPCPRCNFAPATRATGDGARLIAEERGRQTTVEGWTAEHDNQHTGGELALAAVAYASPNAFGMYAHPPAMWPWGRGWWKPSDDRVRDLVKAGALIAAEIDRLIRVKSTRT